MIDVEQELRDALQAYASSVTPVQPQRADMARIESLVVRQPSSRPRRARLFGVAAALLLVIGGVATWGVLRRQPKTVLTPTTEVVEPLPIGTWETVPTSPLSPRKLPAVVWAGDEFIVWSGQQASQALSDGAAYNPSTQRWRSIRPNPRAHAGANAVWTGSRMVVLARSGGESYDPKTDSWSPLPTIDLSTSGGVGFTDAIWTGTQLLGFGLELSEPNTTAVLRVWALDVAQAAWVPVEPISITNGIPRSRFVAEADQFVTWNPVSTSDGFVVWDGVADGWRYSTVTGWTKLPTLAVPGLGSDSAVAWVSGHLVAIASVRVHDSVTADNTDHIAIATLDADRWSTMQLVADGWVFKPSPIDVDERMVVLNGPRPEPLLVDPTASHAGAMTGYPIDTVLDQGAAWSGTEFFVWGGQTPMNSSSSTTDDSSTLSNKGAIWRP
jgi:hypothetical protein